MHRKGMCPECSRVVATTADREVWRHDHASARGRIVCPGTGRPAVDILPRQLEIPAEQLLLVDLVDQGGRLVAIGVSTGEPEALEDDGLFVA